MEFLILHATESNDPVALSKALNPVLNVEFVGHESFYNGEYELAKLEDGTRYEIRHNRDGERLPYVENLAIDAVIVMVGNLPTARIAKEVIGVLSQCSVALTLISHARLVDGKTVVVVGN